MYLHICTTYKRANGRQANQYTHLGHAYVDTSNMITFKHKHTHTHVYICMLSYYLHTIILYTSYSIIVYMDKCCKHSHKTPVINDAFPPLSFSRDNSANRRSTSCPMSLKAPAACEFAGDWWRVDRKRREFLTRVSPLEIFNGHIYGTYIRPLRFWAMGIGNIFTKYGLKWYSTFSLEVLKFHWNSIEIWGVSEEWTIFSAL